MWIRAHEKACLPGSRQAFKVVRGSFTLRGHGLATRFFATAAGVGAFMAMLHVGTVLLAFVAAGLAHLRAFTKKVLCMLRATGYQTGSQGTDISTVAV